MTHPHSLAARRDKISKAHASGLNEDIISDLVEGFYGKVRRDDLLGPIFDKHVTDWEPHLSKMKNFWASIAIESGRYSGSPMQKHIAVGTIDKHHFDRWLQLFEATVGEIVSTKEGQEFLKIRARRIASSLMMGISINRDGLVGLKS